MALKCFIFYLLQANNHLYGYTRLEKPYPKDHLTANFFSSILMKIGESVRLGVIRKVIKGNFEKKNFHPRYLITHYSRQIFFLNFDLKFLGHVRICTKLPPINGFCNIARFSSIFGPKTACQLFNWPAVLPEVGIVL